MGRFVLCALVCALGCDGDDGGSADRPDAHLTGGHPPDAAAADAAPEDDASAGADASPADATAPPDGGVADAPVPDADLCHVAASYELGAIASGTGLALVVSQSNGDPVYLVQFPLGPDPGDPVARVELYTGFGVFDPAVQTGTFTIEGAETNYQDCGACILLLADFDGTGEARLAYLAQSGTLTVSEFEPDRFVGSLANVVFAEVDSEGRPRAGGCTTSLLGASWSESY
jgi:hypothetical protein